MKKWIKISILVSMVIFILCINVGASFYGGTSSTNRYFTPSDFDFQIFGITAELTPTISYANGMIYTLSSDEYTFSSDLKTNVVTRDNFSISTLNNNNGVLKVSYKLSFDLATAVDSFTIKITCPDGLYSFIKYGIPQIKVPTGYTASYNLEYHLRYTLEQSFTTQTGTMVTRSNSAFANYNIDLLEDKVLVNNVANIIDGDVFIDNYSCTITFTKDNVTQVGDSGFYMWDNVLSTTGDIDEMMASHAFFEFECVEDVYLYGNHGGTLASLQVLMIAIREYDGWSETFLEYDVAPDQTIICYSYGTDKWYGATGTDDGIEINEITAEQMRMLHFTESLEDTLEWVDADEYPNVSGKDVFIDYILDNTTYYSSNPLTQVDSTIGTPYAFTDGDGGLYVSYYVDRNLGDQFDNALTNLFELGYGANNSHGSNGIDLSWIGNTIKGVFDVPLFGFSLGDIFGILLALVVAIAFLKLFAGG